MTAIDEGIGRARDMEGPGLGAPARWIFRCWRDDADRRALWAPVLFGVGAGVYFLLKAEPPVWLGPGLAAILAGALLFWRRVRGAPPEGVVWTAGFAILFIAAGFAAVTLRTAIVAAPVLEKEHGPVTVSGRVVSVDRYGEKGGRVVIAPEEIERLARAETPEKLRVSWRGALPAMRAGDHISVRAVLRPPPEPAAPGAFDFARQAYFQRLGAVGYAVGAPEIEAADNRPVADLIETAREGLAARIRAAADGDPGAISAALVTGKREAISRDAETALRDTGLAHLLAISGLHVGLVSGFIFLGLRSGLALAPGIALRYPIKKWAAAAALLGASGYLLLSGASWSTQRAFLMAGLVFAAVLFDRRALSLRNVAIAALLILILAPEAVLHAGFQMSFAAVTALIAAYEWARDKGVFYPKTEGAPFAFRAGRSVFVHIAGIALTTIIAEIATGAYSVHHFQHFADYGLIANLVAMPVMAFWIMPWAVIGACLIPFGLDMIAWGAMAFGVEIVLFAAEWVQSLPGSVTHIAAPPFAGTALMTAGGLWLCLWRAGWRHLGWGVALAGLVMVFTGSERAEFHVNRDGRNAALLARDADGDWRYALYSKRRDKFTAETWLRRNGEPETVRPALDWTDAGACDPLGCAGVSARGVRVTLLMDLRDPEEDCARSDVVVSLQKVSRPLRRMCAATGAAEVIDRIDIWRDGAHSVYLRDGEIVVDTVRSRRGVRPWAPGRGN